MHVEQDRFCRPLEPGALEEAPRASPPSSLRLHHRSPSPAKADGESTTSASTVPRSTSFVIAPHSRDVGPDADAASNDGSWTTIDTVESFGPNGDTGEVGGAPAPAEDFQLVSPAPSPRPADPTVPSPRPAEPATTPVPSPRRVPSRRAAHPLGPTTRKPPSAIQKLQRGAVYTRQVCVAAGRAARDAVRQLAHMLSRYLKALNGRILYVVIPLATVGGASVCVWHLMRDGKGLRVADGAQGAAGHVSSKTRALVAATQTQVVRLHEAVACLDDGTCRRVQSLSVNIV